MGVDTTLKYGQYNTYKMDANEKLYADPFDVSQYSVITMQLVTIRTAGATTCEVGARWIDANNRKMGSDVLLTVNVLNRFSDWHHTLEVPEGAKGLQWWIKAGSASFNWACGKISPGSMPTAFSADLTERTSMMTADGLYTSTIIGDQVIAGIIMALNQGAWFNLGVNPEIVMKSSDGKVTWKASPDNPLQILDEDDKLIAGLVKHNNQYGHVSKYLSTSTNLNEYYGMVGVDQDEVYVGLHVFYGNNTFSLAIDDLNEVTLSAGDFVRQIWDADGGVAFGGTETGRRFVLDADGGCVIRDHLGNDRLVITQTGFYIKAPNGVMTFYQDQNQTIVQAPFSNGSKISLTQTGATKTVDGTTTNL